MFYRENIIKVFAEENDGNKLKIKYYKGLGTNSDKEIKDTFGKYVIKYDCDNNIEKNMNLVFNNKQSDDRKDWMTKYTPEYPPENINNLSISDYLNKNNISSFH